MATLGYDLTTADADLVNEMLRTSKVEDAVRELRSSLLKFAQEKGQEDAYDEIHEYLATYGRGALGNGQFKIEDDAFTPEDDWRPTPPAGVAELVRITCGTDLVMEMAEAYEEGWIDANRALNEHPDC